MIQLAIPTTRIAPEIVRDLRWHHAVDEVDEYRVDDRTVLLVWETESAEIAYTQLTRLAGHMIGAYQLFTDDDLSTHVTALGAHRVAG